MPQVPLRTFAKMFEMSPQNVSALVAKGMPALPAAKPGGPRLIDVRQAHEWLKARAIERAVGSDGAESLEQAELRRARADADIAEARLARRREELLPRETAVAAMALCLGAFDKASARMVARLAPSIAPESSPAVIRQLVHDAARRARAEMADALDGGAGRD